VRSRAFVAGACAALVALAIAYAGLRWGVLVAGGSDSYGYISQAELWRRGTLTVQQPIVRPTPWPLAAETWTPLGYRPSPRARAAYVPMYAPGLPLLMAAAQAIAGFCAAFTIVPLCGASAVWLTFVLGRQLFDPPRIALGGAVLVAASPVFLYQVINAMSDVPATAFWTLAVVLAVTRRPFASGLAMAVAIAIRPNLAPLAAVIAAWMWISEAAGKRWRSLLRFAAGTAPAVIAIAWLNARLYESPFTSGYGATADLYSLQHFAANVRNYASWLAEVETPIVALSALYIAFPAIGQPPRLRGARLLAGGTMAAMVLSYLFYQPFDVWWYLRFLLPMWPVMMLATVAAIDGVARRVQRSDNRPAFAAVAMTAIVLLLAAHHLRLAAARGLFDLGRTERKYVDVARWVADHTEPDAVLLSHQHSGSLRLYAGRLTLRFDILEPEWLDRALAWLQSTGRHPYIVLDGEELARFRARFVNSSAGALTSPPIGELNDVVFVYDALRAEPSRIPLAIASTRGSRSLFACDPPPAPRRPASP
jgi:hypothetical protein